MPENLKREVPEPDDDAQLNEAEFFDTLDYSENKESNDAQRIEMGPEGADEYAYAVHENMREHISADMSEEELVGLASKGYRDLQAGLTHRYDEIYEGLDQGSQVRLAMVAEAAREDRWSNLDGGHSHIEDSESGAKSSVDQLLAEIQDDELRSKIDSALDTFRVDSTLRQYIDRQKAAQETSPVAQVKSETIQQVSIIVIQVVSIAVRDTAERNQRGGEDVGHDEAAIRRKIAELKTQRRNAEAKFALDQPIMTKKTRKRMQKEGTAKQEFDSSWFDTQIRRLETSLVNHTLAA